MKRFSFFGLDNPNALLQIMSALLSGYTLLVTREILADDEHILSVILFSWLLGGALMLSVSWLLGILDLYLSPKVFPDREKELLSNASHTIYITNLVLLVWVGLVWFFRIFPK